MRRSNRTLLWLFPALLLILPFWAAAQPVDSTRPPNGDLLIPTEDELISDLQKEGEGTPGSQYVGDRDPFNLPPEPGGGPQPRPSGIEGLAISELALVGIFRGQLGAHAVFQVADTKSYTLSVGDAVYNGKLKSILDNEVIFEQQDYDAMGNLKEPVLISVRLYPL